MQPLPEPSNVETIDPIPFSIEASLVHRLGAESVSDQILSVIELIKNSYDADAAEVVITLKNFRTGNPEIIITDDGSGMNEDEIKDGWMRIGTSIKSNKGKTPIHHRRLLGQKGIGRFAVENLSRETTIVSYPRNQTIGYTLHFIWNKYSKGQDLPAITNKQGKFQKPKEVNGMRIHLQDLRQRWQENDVQRLRNFIRSLTPPAVSDPKFRVVVDTDEFEDLSGNVDSNFLENAVFTFELNLSKSGIAEYIFRKHGESKPVNEKKATLTYPFACGPLNFIMYFYYRTKNKMKEAGIDITDMDSFRKILGDYGGIKIYRDMIRLSGFGNPDDDWTGLDAMARNDPSVVPARNQILGIVNISSVYNPEINDTTTRESVIKNQSFQDLLRILQEAIGIFSQMRGEIEQKRRKAPKPVNKYIKRAKENVQKSKNRKELLDFANQYPLYFYKNLEDEINFCYLYSLPNATLVMCRKLVENLLFNILQEKFPREIALRMEKKQGRPHFLSILIDNIEERIGKFDVEQKQLIYALMPNLKNFRKNANRSAHSIIEYLESIDDIDTLKIPDIVQIALQLRTNIHDKK